MKKVISKALLGGLAASAILATQANAGPTFYFGDGKTVEFFFMNQLWGVYTMDRTECSGGSVGGIGTGCKDYSNRTDFFLRRSRFGAQGTITENLSWRVWFAYDNVGLDSHTALANSNKIGLVGQNSNNKEFYLWDAFFTYALDKNWANITVGYFRPQVGRESITAGFEVNSFEKALTNFYPREHIVGTGPGRATGINIGGLYNDEKSKWGINYNFGIFDIENGNTKVSGGNSNSPLLTARVALSIGDPEMKKYGMGYKVNYFGKRNGITIALNATQQGATTESFSGTTYSGGFKKNNMYGVDILANYADFTFNFEYDWLKRELSKYIGFKKADGKPFTSNSWTDKVWHVRAGYNFKLPNKTILEPAITYAEFKGDSNSGFYPNGKDKVLDVGLNWYIDQNKIKLNAHYVKQKADPVSKLSAYQNDSVGDYVGVGLQLIF